MKDAKLTYKQAGVDIAAANEAVERIKSLVASTHQSWVLATVGPFSGSLRLKPINVRYQDPILVQSTDGVGTKIMIAETMGNLDTIGADLVNHCANDLITAGPVEFVSFLDYIGTDKLVPTTIEQIMIGLAKACQEITCPIIGGEMAEMPDIYKSGRHDLVGLMTGVVEYEEIIDGTEIQPGDQLIGLASSGLHTNGFSLARRVVFDKCGFTPDVYIEELGTTIGKELLKPHRSYVKSIIGLLARGIDVHGLAHITGGGLRDNLVRILPEGCRAVVYKNRWPVPPIFSFLQEKGEVDGEEMFFVFNMGIGMVVVVPGWQADKAAQSLEWYLGAQEGDKGLGAKHNYAFQIGDIRKGKGESAVEIV